jgi:tetratricopeptide (TPR) repeat protein
LDEAAFGKMSDTERFRFVSGLALESLDSANFISKYKLLLAIAEAKKDNRTAWLLLYSYFQQRRLLRLPEEEIIALLSELESTAGANHFEIERLVANHYAIFEKYNNKKMPYEQVYVAILQEYENMQAIGFEKFRDYNIARLLFHSGRFMFQLEDFEKALLYLKEAERFVVQDDKNLQTCFLVLNHIQSVFQQQKEYSKGIEYGKKILQIAQTFQTNNPESHRWCQEWQGIANIDIASMLVGQHRFAEGESYANKGYDFVKSSDGSGFQTEYEALTILVPAKLELGKLNEAAALLQRMKFIYDSVGQEEYFYFKNIRFLDAYAKYYEMRGDYAAAIHYTQLAQPIKDSLERRNDVRKLEKIKQRMDAEKYKEKLLLVENEKQLQQWLRNAALVILLLVALLAFGNYQRLQAKSRQALAELETARSNLETFTQGFREKSDLVDHLRIEIEKLSRSGERSDYLEKLTQSTILTEEDWLEFKLLFEKVHPHFIAEQKNIYPDLTPAETRLLVLEQLNLSTHEMANMLGVSKNTINQTRSRLRRKTGNV